MNLITHETEGLSPLVGDLAGKTLVIRANALNRRYQLPRFQLFKATGGFGCKESSLGSKVFGVFVADNEDGQYRRNDFIGIATDQLIRQAMADARAVEPIDLAQRVYLLVSKDQHYAKGDTVEQAMQRLRRMTRSAVVESFRVHPEAIINELGFMTCPAGTEIAEVKIKKQGGVWIDAS